eukprot:3038895-Prymnesium_polylepis.3
MWSGISKTPKIIIWVQNQPEFCTRNDRDSAQHKRDNVIKIARSRRSGSPPRPRRASNCTHRTSIHVCA